MENQVDKVTVEITRQELHQLVEAIAMYRVETGLMPTTLNTFAGTVQLAFAEEERRINPKCKKCKKCDDHGYYASEFIDGPYACDCEAGKKWGGLSKKPNGR